MKIAILSFYSGHIDRGIETWTREFASRMTSKGHKVVVFQGDKEVNKVNYSIKIIKTKINWKIKGGILELYWLMLPFIFAIRATPVLFRLDPDIIMPTNGGLQVSYLRILSWLFGWKMVVTAHAGMGAPDKWNILMQPDHYVFPSNKGLVWGRRLPYGKLVEMSHITHGVDLKRFRPQIKSKKLGLQRPVILCVSSFDGFKRVGLAIKAVAKLKKGSLLVLGGDDSSDGVNRLAKKLLKDRYLRMKVPHKEIPGYYVASDIFTLPSNKYEAFGIAYLEAMACGLPVVATDDALRREIVGDAGILVDPTDISAYTKALERALNTKWGNKPRKQAEKFSWDNVVNKYEKIFKSLK